MVNKLGEKDKTSSSREVLGLDQYNSSSLVQCTDSEDDYNITIVADTWIDYISCCPYYDS